MNMESRIEEESIRPLTCVELLKKFEEKESISLGKEMHFLGVGGRDVYNITAPFRINNKNLIVGRVEHRKSTDSEVMFFEEQQETWSPTKDSPVYSLEDGFITRVGDEAIFGGVEVYPIDTGVGYRTVFYRGESIHSFEKFAVGPEGMKDIRLVDLKNGKIGVFTRPQGEIGGKGKIGYLEIDTLEDLNNNELILNARIIENQFANNEWGGTNDIHLLPDGRIGVVGHIAYQDEQDAKHYYGMSFIYDPQNHEATPIEILATIKNFPEVASKNDGLKDIVFPSNLVLQDDGTATLYAGLSDAKAGQVTLKNPFI